MAKTSTTVLVEKEIETKKETTTKPSTINNYYFTSDKPVFEQKKEHQTKRQVAEQRQEQTDLDLLLKTSPKEETITFTEEQVLPEEDYKEDYQEYEKTYSTAPKFPIVWGIVAFLMAFMAVFNIASVVSYSIGIERTKNEISLSDLKLKKLATQIGSITGDSLNDELEEEDYIEISDENTITIELNEKKIPPSYKSTNWFDWICNIIFKCIDK